MRLLRLVVWLAILVSFRTSSEGQQLEGLSVGRISPGKIGAAQIAALYTDGYTFRNFERGGLSEWTKPGSLGRVLVQVGYIIEVEGDSLCANGSALIKIGQRSKSAEDILTKRRMFVARMGDVQLKAVGQLNGHKRDVVYLSISGGLISKIHLSVGSDSIWKSIFH